MRYYYTDPLAAAWMVDKFRLTLNDGIGSARTVFHYAYEVGVEKFYIDADYTSFLLPQEDDLICMGNDVIAWVCRNGVVNEISPEVMRDFITIKSAECFIEDHEAKIIQRNGVAFMWPEREDLGDSLKQQLNDFFNM